MQRLPQQALELGIRFVLRLGRRDRKRHRRQRTHRHRTGRKSRTRRAAAVCRADRNRIVDLPADLQIITCTGLDADKLARKRSCEIVVGGRRRVRAIQGRAENEIGRKKCELAVIHKRGKTRVAQQLQSAQHPCRAAAAAACASADRAC